jgi:hypothetical protein
MTTGIGDGLMQLLRQIADDLDELRGEERRHVSALERTTKRVRAIETLRVRRSTVCRAVQSATNRQRPAAADVQLLPPTRLSDIVIVQAAD